MRLKRPASLVPAAFSGSRQSLMSKENFSSARAETAPAGHTPMMAHDPCATGEILFFIEFGGTLA